MTPIHPFTRELQNHRVDGDETSNPEYTYHNGNFGEYFRNKQVKLDTQAKEQFQLASDIFKDCVLYITGHTVPSAAELKRIIVANGGQVCAFLGGKSYATHIVAATLTSRKKVEYANYKVVLPSWVIESAKMGYRLDWTNYRTIHTSNNSLFRSLENDVDTLREDAPEDAPNDVSNMAEDVPEGAPDGLPDGVTEGVPVDVPMAGTEGSRAVDSRALLNAPGADGDEARKQWILMQRKHTNCLDPDYISSYFARSRLHFLSTRKLELRRRCRQYKPPAVKSQPARTVLLHVDFDSFFVAVALKKHPELANKPVCVSHGSASSDIASCNYVARKFGVKNGSWVSAAKIRCPGLICLPYDFEEYVRCSDVLYETLLALCPLHITAISVDEAIIDISNLAVDVAELCQDIRTTIYERTGIHVSAGAGSNILLAKMALRRAKPAGYHVMSPKEIGDFGVKDLPGVGRHIESKLQELAVHTVADLCSVPLNVLQARIGKAHGQRLYDYARARDTSDITKLDTAVRTVGLEIGWGVRLLDANEKRLFIDNCVKELWDRLKRAGQNCESLTVKVYRKSDSAGFLPPKFLGHGLCDISSRSRKVAGQVTFSGLTSVVHQLVEATPCPPLEMRGLGLHMRVVDDEDKAVEPQQTRITSDRFAKPRTPRTPPKLAIPAIPRKRRHREMTLTQKFTHVAHVNVDAAVLAELPTQIRKEIMINEDEYVVARPMFDPSLDPVYHRTEFLNLDESGLRHSLREWVLSAPSPTADDAKAFYEFVRTGIEDANWTRILEIVDWFGLCVEGRGTEDWVYLHGLVDALAQQRAAAFVNDVPSGAS